MNRVKPSRIVDLSKEIAFNRNDPFFMRVKIRHPRHWKARWLVRAKCFSWVAIRCFGCASLTCRGAVLCAGAAHLDDLLRDIGTAAAFLEQQRGGEAIDGAADSLPPRFVAAAALAAAEYVQRLGMPATHALLRKAAASAVSAAAAASSSAAEPVVEASCSGGKACAVGECRGAAV